MTDARERLRSCVTLGDVEWAVKHIDAKEARIAELEAAQAEALDRAQVWLDAAMARKKFTSDCLDQYGEKMGEAEYAANLNVHDSCMDRIAIIQALFPDLARRALEAKP